MRSIISLSQAVTMLRLRIYGDQDTNDNLVPTDVSDIYIMCPKCGHLHQSRRLTLNLDFEKNVFRCARCGLAGSVYTLISIYTGWPYETVEAHIQAGELGTVHKEVEREIESSTDGVNAIAPLKQRNDVYSALLKLLVLTETHRTNLLNRGLSQKAIDQIGFKSYPKFMDPEAIPKKLLAAGYDLRGVPGFFINQSGRWAMARLQDSGFFIPSRNGQGLIMGCQIRFDHPNDKIPKYGYFTSAKMPGGTKAETWCSWAGENLLQRKNKEPFDIILIEGPLKAYIVNATTGCNVIAVPGVSSLCRIPAALQSMSELGLRCTYIAYDMDQFTNKDVQKQLCHLKGLLDNLNLKHKTLNWNSEYKGLDDWIVGPEFTKLRSQLNLQDQ